MEDIIKIYVEKSISFVRKYKEYLMYVGNIEKQLFGITIHPDMNDDFNISDYDSLPQTATFKQVGSDGYMLDRITADCFMWKPIDAEITDADIEQLENEYAIKLPEDYRCYLKYKYFYQIFWMLNIRLYPKPKDSWMDILKMKNEAARKYDLATKDHFVIGTYSDYADIAINAKNNKIEMLDWGIFDIFPLADSFTDMLSMALRHDEPIIKKK